MQKILLSIYLLSASIACASDRLIDDARQTQTSNHYFYKKVKDQLTNALAFQYYLTSTVGYITMDVGLEAYMHKLYIQDPNIQKRVMPLKSLDVQHLSLEDIKDLDWKRQSFKLPPEELIDYEYKLQFLQKVDGDTLLILAPSVFEAIGTTSVLSHFPSQPLLIESYQIFTRHILKDLIKENPGKRLQIYAHYATRGEFAQPAVGLMAKAHQFLFGSCGHYVFTSLSIDPINKKIDVSSVDPSLEFQGNAMENRLYFEKLSKALDYQLNSFEYLYRGDQTLNMHDCGRFASIYMDEALKGRNLKTLESIDIYRGFKKLEANGYEQFQQKEVTATGEEVILASPSVFARVMGIRRAFAEYALSWLAPNPDIVHPSN